ncbi:MAG: SurA N-terminal domain-containing protein [Pseudomonadales bacterium]|nr:SurA N-terminal domain-containing protein [Pseudomonadales bacterium]
MSIQSMRDRSEGVVAKIIVGLIIIVFAAFGMGSITTFLAPVAKVATVNGEDVTQQEMEVEVERTRRILLSQNRTPESINEDQLRSDVLQNLITRKLLIQASEDMGLEYGNTALDADIVATQAFQIDGDFNSQQFQLVLGSAGYNPLSYRSEMRRDKILAQINSAIHSSAFLTEAEIRRANSLAQQTRDIAFLRVDIEALSETIELEENEVNDFYLSHSTDFLTEEAVDISFLEINLSDYLNEVEVSEEQLQLFFADTKSVYAEPERRRIAHILIDVSDERSEEDAKSQVDDIYQQLISGGDFTTLAKELSADVGSSESGGDLGFNDQGTFVEEFELAAQALSVNQLSEPVKTEFGYHILKLLDIEAAVEPVFSDVRDRVETEFRKVGAEELFVNISSRLSELSYESGDLIEPAEELGLEIRSTGLTTKINPTGIAAIASVMDAALSPDVLLDGNNSHLLEITPNHHLVLRVKEYQPSEIKALEVVATEISKTLKLEKASALAKEQAQAMTTMLEDGSITRFVADKFNLQWTVVGEAKRNQLGMDREINREAFSLPRPSDGNKSIGYTILLNGDAAVLVVTNVQNKTESDSTPEDLVSLGRVLASQQGISDYREFRDNLVLEGSVATTN